MGTRRCLCTLGQVFYRYAKLPFLVFSARGSIWDFVARSPFQNGSTRKLKLFACMRTNTFLLGRAESFVRYCCHSGALYNSSGTHVQTSLRKALDEKGWASPTRPSNFRHG